jgi:hypothetical protein
VAVFVVTIPWHSFPREREKEHMRQEKGNLSGKSRPVAGKQVPSNRDTLDSRKNLEQDFKGNDITHNLKKLHSDRKKNR